MSTADVDVREALLERVAAAVDAATRLGEEHFAAIESEASRIGMGTRHWSAVVAVDAVLAALGFTVADAPAAEPEYPKPCSNCGALYSTCTERIQAGRRACCGTCGYTATHDQNAWEAWDRQRTHVPAAEDEGGRE